jgi:hypothetical protein
MNHMCNSNVMREVVLRSRCRTCRVGRHIFTVAWWMPYHLRRLCLEDKDSISSNKKNNSMFSSSQIYEIVFCNLAAPDIAQSNCHCCCQLFHQS